MMAPYLPLSRAAGGGRRGACLSPTDDVARGGLAAAVAPPCPGASDPGGAVVWPLPSCPPGGIGPLPRRPRATACGVPPSPGLADRGCAAWGGPSRAVSHLRTGPGVHRHDPAWGCATICTGWGARGMRAAHDRLLGESGQGGGCLAVALWWPCAGRDAVGGTHRARAADGGPTGEAVRACGRRDGVGVTRPKLQSASEYSRSGRIRTRSVQPRALRSAQGRACVHRGALSPEHSREHPNMLSEVAQVVETRRGRRVRTFP
jgi:hypothetical protein